jgi:hypothetical protein
MAHPICVCIEDLDATGQAERFLRCVALPGIEAGLSISTAGATLWKRHERGALEIWVSADDRLMLFRPPRGVPTTLRRAGRALEVPVEKPVVLLDQDQLETGGRRLRLHLHGEATSVHAPTPFRPERGPGPGGVGRVVAAASIAIGAAVGAVPGRAVADGAEPPPIEVRESPPKMAPPEKPDAGPKQPPKKKPPKKAKKG